MEMNSTLAGTFFYLRIFAFIMMMVVVGPYHLLVSLEHQGSLEESHLHHLHQLGKTDHQPWRLPVLMEVSRFPVSRHSLKQLMEMWATEVMVIWVSWVESHLQKRERQELSQRQCQRRPLKQKSLLLSW